MVRYMGVSAKYDIAIVGAGIAGLYCCLNAHPDKKIGLFEASHKIGGRIETVDMEGFFAEYGSMRFDPSRQFLMQKLIQDLGLETEHFPEYSSPSIQNRQTIYNLKEREKELTTLELIKVAIQRVLDKSEEQLLSMNEEELDHIRREAKYKGEYLWKQGLWSIFSDVLSFDAIKFLIIEGSFYHSIHENPNSVEWMIVMIKMFQMSKNLKGIKNGMQQLTNTMFEKIKEKGVVVYKQHTLQDLGSSGGKDIILLFNNGKTFKTKHVILAIPQKSLLSVNSLPDNIKLLLHSVMSIPLLKCFFVVKNPWWKQNVPNEGLTTFPARELHYYKHAGKGNIMVYCDRPYITFWSEYVKAEFHDKTELGRNEELPKMFAHLMKIDPSDIIICGIRDWGKEPYGGAYHIWKPGIQSWIVIDKLTSFALREDSPKNIHICGEAFSDYQGFMEGALRSARNVMAEIQL